MILSEKSATFRDHALALPLGRARLSPGDKKRKRGSPASDAQPVTNCRRRGSGPGGQCRIVAPILRSTFRALRYHRFRSALRRHAARSGLLDDEARIDRRADPTQPPYARRQPDRHIVEVMEGAPNGIVPKPTTAQEAEEKEIRARGTSDPRVIREGTIAYLITLDDGFRIMYRDSGGHVTDQEKAVMARVGGV